MKNFFARPYGTLRSAKNAQVAEGDVVSIVILYNEDLSDEDIIDYYKNAGYTITDTGEVDEEEGTPIYIFSNASTRIVYSCARGVATRA